MARPPKLDPQQRADVSRRLAAGEGVRALAREYRVDPAVISRIGVAQQSQRVKTVAHQLADAQAALAELPNAQQYQAISLAERLRNISSSLAGAAEIGASNAQRLHAMALGQIGAAEGGDVEALRYVAAATKTANDAASLGLQLIGVAQREGSRVNPMQDQEQDQQDGGLMVTFVSAGGND